MKADFIIANSKYKKNTFFLILHPQVNSFLKVIDDINQSMPNKYSGIIKVDLLLMTGERDGRFIEGKIKNGTIQKSSFTPSSEDTELTELLKKIYTDLPKGDIDKIYPISYRKHLYNLKCNK